MALAPITRGLATVASLNNPSPPARPALAQERMPVPGRPQAEAQRPAVSPGRIPIPESADTPTDHVDMVEQIDEQVKGSREYQAIRPFLPQREHGEEDERPRDDKGRREGRVASPVRAADIGPSQTRPLEGGLAPESTRPAGDGVNREPATVQKSDPLALDLDGDGLKTTGVDRGVAFDVDADGELDRVSFVSGGDAFLALDRNGNGRIDDGSELFGDQRGHANGFSALAEHDDNSDGLIDSGDQVFAHLRLFRMSAEGSQQLSALGSVGVQAIRLDHRDSAVALNTYDSVAQTGVYVRDDGSEGMAGDLMLGHRDLEA